MSSRSIRLLLAGLTLLALAGLAMGVRSGQRPAPAVIGLAAPVLPARPPVVASRDAIRQAAGLSDAFIAIAETVTPAVVRISAERADGGPGDWLSQRLHDFFGPPLDSLPELPPAPGLAGGTGFLVSTNGYILTNNHVIDGADRITVALRDKRVFEARLVGRDPTTDVAVLKIEGDDFPALPLGDSDGARVGEWVLAVGNPGFDDASTLDFTVTGGIISAKGRPLNLIPQGLLATEPDASAYAIEDFIQTDAVINPGNSGGPLVDLRGSVIGINTAIASTTGFSQGYGFAIPANLVQRVMRDLIAHGHVRRPLLGVSISEVGPEDAEVYGLPEIAGVLVEDLPPDSPARRAGLDRHDVIVAVDGQRIERVGQLQRTIALRDPGDTVRVSAIRYGEPLEAAVRLGQAPIPEPPARAAPRRATPARPAPGLGLEVADLTAASARRWGFSRPGGVVVARVDPVGAAGRRRIIEGHRLAAVGRSPVTDARSARFLIDAAPSGQVLSLTLETPDGRTYIANVRVP